MVGIPPSLDSDAEDVVWALQTAASLWKRHERVDAIVWLRRAAQAAGEAEDDDRAFVLAKDAAELTDWITNQPVPSEPSPPMTEPPAPPASIQPASGDGIDDLLRASQADIQVAERAPQREDEDAERLSLTSAEIIDRSAPAPRGPPPLPTLREREDEAPVIEMGALQSIAPGDLEATIAEAPRILTPAPTAAEAHAGMLDPWAEKDESRESRVPTPPPLPFDPEEVVTSAPAARSPVPSAAAARPPPLPPSRLNKPPLPKPRRPAPLPAEARDERESPDASERAEEDVPTPVMPPVVEDVPTPIVPPVAAAAPPSTLDLAAIEAFADLPDDARDEFARAARIEELAKDDETATFALALVVRGSVDVSAQIVDAPAERFTAGAVLRSRGTLDPPVPIRLHCASETATIATWTDEAVLAAFRTCPWVEDDLRAAGDRVQALVGVTMGPLGERLDTSLRVELIRRFTLKVLAAAEVFATEGEPIPGILVVGGGELDLVRGEVPAGTVRPGEFLFANEVLGASPAPATARACSGGALVFVADRKLAQELLVTYPSLLEIFAGM